MPTKQSTADYILEQLIPVGYNVAVRKMFSGYALYADGQVVGLICNDKLFIKITEPGKKFVGKQYRAGHAYPGARVSMKINDDQIEDSDWLSEMVQITADNLPEVKKLQTKKLK